MPKRRPDDPDLDTVPPSPARRARGPAAPEETEDDAEDDAEDGPDDGEIDADADGEGDGEGESDDAVVAAAPRPLGALVDPTAPYDPWAGFPPPADPAACRAFYDRWADTERAERANKDTYLIELCALLGVPAPAPVTGDPARDAYVFEKDAVLQRYGGRTIGKIDLYKAGCFIWEAKQWGTAGGRPGGIKRETPSWYNAVNDAWGQARRYASTFDQPPPFLVVSDIGYAFDLYATFNGGHDHKPFPNAQTKRLYLKALVGNEAERVHLLRTLQALFIDPRRLDPARISVRTTRAVAAVLGRVSAEMERYWLDQQRKDTRKGEKPPKSIDQKQVAKFLMRCLFTMFAESVGLLMTQYAETKMERRPFSSLLGRARRWPHLAPYSMETLWRKMNAGEDFSATGPFRRFNGGLFADARAVPLSGAALDMLWEASKYDWSQVEPAVFGTLLERALRPEERHRLGAHFTPRPYVERLVRFTIDRPLRREWDAVRLAARRHHDEGRDADAVAVLKGFLHRLATVRVLDPACGAGNFLYVALAALMSIESEVLAALTELGEDMKPSLGIAGKRVTPIQLRGIEIDAWGREISELVLWIGYLQMLRRARVKLTTLPEPILTDYQNVEQRDAVLAYDAAVPVRDARGRLVTRWDGRTTKPHPTMPDLRVPDTSAKVEVYRYEGARPAAWPDADFVVGNPPFVGDKRMRGVLGHEYAETLRATYPDVPRSADLVLYWWHKAALLLRAGKIRAFGFITTNSITQTQNRKVVEAHVSGANPLRITFAVPDHPWIDEASAAAVRIAMTAVDPGADTGVLQQVVAEGETDPETAATAVTVTEAEGEIHPNLRLGTNLVDVQPLKSNDRVAFIGVQLTGQGFVVNPDDPLYAEVSPYLKPYLVGNELNRRPLHRKVIDFFGLNEDEARAAAPKLFNRVLEAVKPKRDATLDPRSRLRWWVFAGERLDMRAALAGLPRYIAICRTAKHLVFQFVPAGVVPESKVVAIASDDAWILGVLSSRAHVTWAQVTGSRHGVGNDFTYNHTTCFPPFPFPDATPAQQAKIRKLGAEIDAFRKARLAEHAHLTITGLYNALQARRDGTIGTADEKTHRAYRDGLVETLFALHNALDAAVLAAYGLPAATDDTALLDHLARLNHERAAEEAAGRVRYLRPEFQNPGAPRPAAATQPDLDVPAQAPAAEAPPAPWPADLIERVRLVQGVLERARAPLSAVDVAALFAGADAGDAARVLDGLAALGVAVAFDDGDLRRWVAGR